MNKSDLVNEIAQKADISQSRANFVLQAIIEAISESLEKGEEVNLIGFGSFNVAERGERTARNLHTGETIKVPACKVVKFKAGAKLKAAVQ